MLATRITLHLTKSQLTVPLVPFSEFVNGPLLDEFCCLTHALSCDKFILAEDNTGRKSWWFGFRVEEERLFTLGSNESCLYISFFLSECVLTSQETNDKRMTTTDDEFENRRNELFAVNTKIWEGEENVFKTSPKLDSSLKKNTAFIKKIRLGINKESEKQLIDGIKTVSLEKYLHEISAALCESLCKVSKSADIESAVEVVSALHQRFGMKFTPFIGLYFAHTMETPKTVYEEKEDKDRLVKIRNMLRLCIEFHLCGIFKTVNDLPVDEMPHYLQKIHADKKADIPLLIPLLKEVMSYKFETGLTIPVITSIIKRFRFFYTELNPRFEDQESVYMRKLFKSYIKNASSMTLNLNKEIIYQSNKSSTISMKTGRLLEDLNIRVEEMEALFQDFKNFCEFACPLFQLTIPELKVKVVKTQSAVISGSSDIKVNKWENEEMRSFYEDIPTLQSLIPEDVLNNVNSKVLAEDMKGPKFTSILTRLASSETAKEIDAIVVDFWTWGLSNKASRNRLSKHIVDITDVSSFKNIARFLTINRVYFEKCIEDLVIRLDKSFRFQIHHDKFAVKDILIFSELVKFKLIPIYVIFHKVRSLILNIEVHGNIDLLSMMFDGCGNVLLYDDEYKDHTHEMIQLLIKEFKNKKFSHTDKYAVKLFLLSLKPQKAKQAVAELLPEEKFLLHMVKTKLNKKNINRIVAYLLAADWNNAVIYNRIVSILTSPEELKYDDIGFLAEILRKLSPPKNDSLITIVVDQLVEKIIAGLEQNDYVESRARISQGIYFIELINQNLINVDYLIAMLYKIVCFGHANNNPTLNDHCELDLPDDHFRIRMINYMLLALDLRKASNGKTTGAFKTFIRFYHYYTFTKVQTFSLDLKMMYTKIDDKVEAFYKTDFFARPSNMHTAMFLLDMAMSGDVTGEAVKAENNDKLSKSSRQEGQFTHSNGEKASEPLGDSNQGDEIKRSEVDEVDSEDDDSDGDDDDEYGSYMVYDEEEEEVEEEEDDADLPVDEAVSDLEQGENDTADEDEDEEEDEEEEDDNSEFDGSAEQEKHHAIVSDIEDGYEEEERAALEAKSEAFHEAELDLEFERLVRESANTRSNIQVNELLSKSIGAPKTFIGKDNENPFQSPFSSGDNSGVKFTFITRQGKSIQPKTIALPENAAIVQNVRTEQTRARNERDQIKSYILRNS